MAFPIQIPNGWSRIPDELWRTVAYTTRHVIEKAGIDPHEIAGVGVSAQMWNTLPVDEKGNPLTPMMSWLDLRSVKQANRVVSGDNPAFLFKHTGNIPTAKDSIPKILWLKEERPEIWKKTACLMDCKEYILFKLTGKMAIDYVGASVYFLFDPIKKSGRRKSATHSASRSKNCRLLFPVLMSSARSPGRPQKKPAWWKALPL